MPEVVPVRGLVVLHNERITLSDIIYLICTDLSLFVKLEENQI